MCDFDVRRTLQTVGMSCFITHFKALSDESLSTTDLIEAISNENVSEASARTKASAGRRIIRNGYGTDALAIIADSEVVNSTISDSAKLLIQKENFTPSLSVNKESIRIDVKKIEQNIWRDKVEYQQLNARQQENYNMLKLGAVIADYGFDLIRLNDDWQGADCIANHIDGSTFLKVQLKGRLTIDKKYIEKDLYIAFRNEGDWYLYPHDELIEKLHDSDIALHTNSWVEKGHYSWPTLSSRIEKIIVPYKLKSV
jgi:hypothetical protein